MAQELEDGEFWLPSDFLTDDDLLTDFKTADLKAKKKDDFSFGSFFGSNSDLSSPVESVTVSTETESDEDEFVAGLTRKIAQSTLQDSNLFSENQLKGWKLSSSPQSTLCACKPGSNQSSPNCVSRVSSPPAVKDVVGLDFLYAAAGEVEMMRVMDETTPFQPTKNFPPLPKPTPVSVPAKKQIPATGFYPTRIQTQAHLAYLQLQATQFQHMRRQQMMNRGGWGQSKFETGRTQGLSMAVWHTLQQSQQQQPGSGMRAVFLGEPGVKKERTGTGVFLPRTFEANPTETRKKPVCSTVLVPERVVHALNLNIDSIDAQSQRRVDRNLTPEYDVGLKQRGNGITPHQRRSLIPQPVMNQKLGFSQDWSY